MRASDYESAGRVFEAFRGVEISFRSKEISSRSTTLDSRRSRRRGAESRGEGGCIGEASPINIRKGLEVKLEKECPSLPNVFFDNDELLTPSQ